MTAGDVIIMIPPTSMVALPAALSHKSIMSLPVSKPSNNLIPNSQRECPPSAAVDGPKDLYRFALHNPPKWEDFTTPEERGAYKDGDECKRKALSCYASLEGAKQAMGLIPKFKKAYILAGTVPANAGKLLHTPGRSPDHWSWWPTDKFDRPAPFSVVPR